MSNTLTIGELKASYEAVKYSKMPEQYTTEEYAGFTATYKPPPYRDRPGATKQEIDANNLLNNVYNEENKRNEKISINTEN